jgi:ATP-dependent DNA helicase RecG
MPIGSRCLHLWGLTLFPLVDSPTVTPQVTPQLTPQVRVLLSRVVGEMTRQALQDALGLADREHFRKSYLTPALEQGVIEMTLPSKPNSRSQRYRLTVLGRGWLEIDRDAT